MNEPKNQSWWQTMPGMLTAAAGVITAVTGLIVAVSQAGWLDRKDAKADDAAAAVEASSPSEDGSKAAGANPANAPAATAAPSRAPALTPALGQVKVGLGVFTLLDVATEQRTADQAGLRIRVRLQNDNAYPINFWNDLFRLIVDDVPRAPVGDLNKVLAGNAAEEGDVEFTFPLNATSLGLQIRAYGEETVIPLQRAAN